MNLLLPIIVSIFLGFIYAEIAGYFIHIVLHSNRIRYLSTSHMIHHLRLYGPKSPQILKGYKEAAVSRTNVLGIGMEWLFPTIGIISFTYLVGWLLNIPFLFITIFMVSALVWSGFLFFYMHDAMHIEGFWMEKNRLLKKWFLSLRHLHVIHHLNLTDDGRMNTNYGICFFVMDKIFKTFKKEPSKFNDKGFTAAEKTYDYIYKLKI